MPKTIGRCLQSRSLLIALLVLTGFYLMYFAGLGRNPLLDPDEPIYGQYVKEMVATGDWMTPHYAGKVVFDKPPMYYWMSAACVTVLGPTEFALRFPSALSAALIVLLVYLLASYDFGKRAGVIAGVVVGTTLMQVVMSHAAATDAIMVMFTTAALYAYRRWLDSDGYSRLGWIAACGAATGLGMLTKGPVVPLLLAVTICIHLAWTKQFGKLGLLSVLIGVGVCLGVGLPWYARMYALHGDLFVNGFIVKHNLTRFAAPLHKSQGAHWYSYLRNVPLILMLFFPWSVFLLRAVRTRWNVNTGSKLAVCWAAVVLVFFSLSKTQNFPYTYPLFPALAVFVGALFGGDSNGKDWARSLSRSLVTGLVFTLLIAAALIVFSLKKYPEAGFVAVLAACAMVSMFALPILSLRFGRLWNGHVPWAIAAGVVAFNLVAVNMLVPKASDYLSTRTLALRLARMSDVQVAAFKLWKPGLFYYMASKPMDTDQASEVKRLAESDKPVLFVCSEVDEHEVQAYCPNEIFGYGNLDVYANKAYIARQAAERPVGDTPPRL